MIYKILRDKKREKRPHLSTFSCLVTFENLRPLNSEGVPSLCVGGVLGNTVAQHRESGNGIMAKDCYSLVTYFMFESLSL